MYDYLIPLYGQPDSQNYAALLTANARSSHILIVKSTLLIIGYDGSGKERLRSFVRLLPSKKKYYSKNNDCLSKFLKIYRLDC